VLVGSSEKLPFNHSSGSTASLRSSRLANSKNGGTCTF
jgi:hypothetical protein